MRRADGRAPRRGRLPAGGGPEVGHGPSAACRRGGRIAPAAACCLALLLAAACGGAPAEREEAPRRPPEILLHGRHGTVAIPDGDGRAARLLAEVDSLFRGAAPLADAPDPAAVALARRRGALELRFPEARAYVTAPGDTLRLWRVLVPLGVEMLSDPGEAGALLLPGFPAYDEPPLLSRRPRRHMAAILQGPPEGAKNLR